MTRRAPFLAGALALLLAAAPAFAAEPIPEAAPAPGWKMAVLAENLPSVDNLALGPDGALYATLELDQREGRVVRLDREGMTVVLGALQRADGLLIQGSHLFVTEEIVAGRVMMMGLASGRVAVLGNYHKPEGIGLLSNGQVVIAEDRRDGRLLRLDGGGAVTVVAGGLERPEGLAVAADDTIYVAETATGKVLALRDGRLETVAEGITNPDQLRLDRNGHLWVTEDASPGRLLRIGPDGTAVVASGMHFPQGILERGGAMLVAEQGRGRILAFTPSP